jgi:hypothetical protein
MKMLKKMMLLAMAAAAVVAFAAPAAASANWTHNAGELGENVEVEFHGTAQFVGDLGSVHCEDATAFVLLTGNSNEGHIETFEVDNEPNCVVGGLLASLCGTHSLTEAHAEGGLATIEGGTIVLSNIHLVNVFGTCAEVELTDNPEEDATATPDNPEHIHSVSLGGSLEDNLGGIEEISGTLNATPSGTYGIE